MEESVFGSAVEKTRLAKKTRLEKIRLEKKTHLELHLIRRAVEMTQKEESLSGSALELTSLVEESASLFERELTSLDAA